MDAASSAEAHLCACHACSGFTGPPTKSINEIATVYDVANGEVHTAVFIRRGLERALPLPHVCRLVDQPRSLEEFIRLIDGEVLLVSHKDDGEFVVLDLPQSVLVVELHGMSETTPSVFVQIHAGSRQAAVRDRHQVKELIPLADEPAEDQICVGFWYWASRCSRKVVRRLSAPAWEDGARNYPFATRRLLEPLMANLPGVLSGGRLILWHGPAGTGKTSALRTLARTPRTFFSTCWTLITSSGKRAATS